MKEPGRVLVLKGLLGGLLHLALIAAFLIVPAGLVPGGTWCWKRGLIFIGVYGLILEATMVILAVVAPVNLEARLRDLTSKKQPAADKIVTPILLLTFSAWFVSIPLDVFHLKLLPAPGLAVSVGGGGALALLGYAIIVTATCQNAFGAPIVEDQTESGQMLVDTGLYACVRHPMYLGVLPLAAGIALWLGSYTSAALIPILLPVLIARIQVEEKMLRKTLPGYAEYMKKVRSRLVPFIW